MHAAKRIIYNTGIQYLRLLLTVGLSLYSTRFILKALGDIDYGIYNLIAGVVLLLTFVNAAMAVTTQRYLSVAQGCGDEVLQHKVFISSLILHLSIAIILVVGIEIGGIYIFDGFLNIPKDKIFDAQCVYHLMGITVFFSILAVPFTATLIAHENIFWISMVYVIEAILKFIISITLVYFFTYKLIIYGILMVGVSIISFFLYALYCRRKYKECSRLSILYWDRDTIKELGSFASWNLFNVLSNLGETQGVAILLNKFMGASINAAYGIANQVSSQLNFFSQSLLNAVNPQIMKSEGACNRDRMVRLSMITSKYSFFLLAIFAIPCIFEMPAILKFWLKHTPEYTISFCRWMLLAALFNQITVGLASANQATGKIRNYTILICTIRLAVLPLGFLLLKNGYSVNSLFALYALLVGCSSIFRIWFMKKSINLNMRDFFVNVLFRLFFPLLISLSICYYMTQIDVGVYRFILTIFTSAFIFLVTFWGVGMDKGEREIFRNLYMKLVRHSGH